MRLYTSNQYQNAENTYYPNAVEITNAETLRLAVGLDHVAAQYQNNKRSNKNFIVSDCLMMDVDNAPGKNDPNDIPSEEWVDLEKIAADLPSVEFYAATSRSHMKEKDGRPARPKFHIYFPIAPVTDADMYRALKVGLQRFYPYFDRNAADSARFFYGNRDAQITHIPGTRTIADYIIPRTLSEPVKPTKETSSSVDSTSTRSTPSSVTTTSVDNGLYNLREVLDAIDPRNLDYKDWVIVGMVLHKYQSAPYYFTVDDWDAWSRRDNRYKANDCYKRWNGFNDTGRVGAASLINFAKAQGWTPPAMVKKQREVVPPPEPPAYMVKDQLIDWDGEIEADEPETRSFSVELSSVQDDPHVAGNEQPSATPAEIPTEIHKSRFVSASDYISSGTYTEDMAYFAKYKGRKTGFNQIDKYLTLYPGLAALGGASSLGKSTFCVNLVDRLALRGETILYFALEQLPMEMVTKSIARIVKENDSRSPITNEHIKNGINTPDVIAARTEYAKIAQNIYYVEGNFHMTAMDIRTSVESFMKEHDGVKPVVIVDYLQLIAPPFQFHGGVREATDENLKTLKDMQKINELFVIVISSFNRDSNLKPIAYEAFKESSMIEYTCDYVWGLQLEILDADNTEFYSTNGPRGGRRETTIDERRSMMNAAMRLTPKQVEFVSLKSRNGRQMYKACFDYIPMHDLFIEAECRNDQSDRYGMPDEDTAIDL